jgi:integrase
VTIGKHGAPWTPEEARKEAKVILGKVHHGLDPAMARDSRKVAPTVKDLIEKFKAEHIDTKLKGSTADEYRRILEKDVEPELGFMLAMEINASHIAKLHHTMRDTPRKANFTLAVLSKMFNLAELWGFREQRTNPCQHLHRYKENHRERYLSSDELQSLEVALVEAERSLSATIYAVAAIRLLLLTGARLNEIVSLRWEDVDLEAGLLRLPDSKTGAKVILLNQPAQALLRELPRAEGNPFVIVGEVKNAHLVNLQKPWRRIRAAAGLPEVRIHDLRHTFASVAVNAGASLPMIGALLGHKQVSTTQRYAHLAMDPLRQQNEKVGEMIRNASTAAQQVREQLVDD